MSKRAHRRTALVAMSVLAVAAGVGPTLAARQPAPNPPFAVGMRFIRLVDHTRVIRLPNGKMEPRPLTTYVRYPAVGKPSATDLADAPADRSAGPFPLVVFGHGFAVTPATYTRLLHTWARAGYVVAAPVFPLGNANAPGGPTEADLVNQPADLSFVISHLLSANASPGDPLNGLIDPSRIAIAGHSDGADTALAVAYNRHFHDPRVRAALILSGAEIPGIKGYTFPPGSPALLATQGTADTLNPPSLTNTFYNTASRPKFLLTLPRAGHLPPYTYQQPQLRIVEHVTIAFLNHYLKHGSMQQLISDGTAPGIAQLAAHP